MVHMNFCEGIVNVDGKLIKIYIIFVGTISIKYLLYSKMVQTYPYDLMLTSEGIDFVEAAPVERSFLSQDNILTKWPFLIHGNIQGLVNRVK